MVNQSDRPGRITLPHGARIHDLAFHEEGVGVNQGVISDNGAVVDKTLDADCAAVADNNMVGFEDAFLEGVRLELAPIVQGAIVTDGDKRENGGDKLVHGSGGISQPRAE